MKSAWSGFYDYNCWDENVIVGQHPYTKMQKLHFATGASGHGIQQAPAIGRAIMEQLIDGSYQTINLSRFGYDRILNNEEVRESNIV